MQGHVDGNLIWDMCQSLKEYFFGICVCIIVFVYVCVHCAGGRVPIVIDQSLIWLIGTINPNA